MKSSFNRQPDHLRAKAAAVAVVCLLVVGTISASLGLARAMMPQVGDIIAFPATGTGGVSTRATLRVRFAGHPGEPPCRLDLPTIQTNGGSLVVEAVLPGPVPVYRMHWAGARTSGNALNCGGSADLLLTPYDVGVLLFAARGSQRPLTPARESAGD